MEEYLLFSVDCIHVDSMDELSSDLVSTAVNYSIRHTGYSIYNTQLYWNA